MNLKQASLATLAYSDIFDYPLTSGEVQNYLLENKATKTQVAKTLSSLVVEHKIGEANGYFFLQKRYGLAKKRITRNKYSKKKYEKAVYFAKLLKLIPTVNLVAITGALSMNNSTASDDIDLLIITAKNTIWTTRFFANLVLLPYKRSPRSKFQNNKACLNIFIDGSDLKIHDENLYTAHEIAQLKPIYNKNNTYAKFVKANSWTYKYLPNWQAESQHVMRKTKYDKRSFNALRFTYLLSRFEKLLKSFQLNYMRSKITIEQIGDTQLFFHPKDTQEKVLQMYRSRLNRLTK